VNNTSDGTFPLGEDYTGGQPLNESDRKLHSLLELGQIIGLDLQMDDMLLQIAQKATEMMNADRFSLFLYDRGSDELSTTVALGMGKKEIRIPSSEGIAGHCFQTGETLNIHDVYEDPRFLKAVDRSTGYRTKSVLCMPFLGRSGQRLGVVELINKKDGKAFTREDETFLSTFNNHAAVFIEMAQLQKERIAAFKKSQEELERLNTAKSKALDHLAHELRTPLALMQGTIRLLKGRLANHCHEVKADGFFDILEKNLVRLLATQQEADKIVRAPNDAKSRLIIDEFDHLWRHIETVSEVTAEVKGMYRAMRDWIVRFVPSSTATLKVIFLYEFVDERLKEARACARNRKLSFYLEGDRKLSVIMEPSILKNVVSGLIKNAVENTPDEGAIYVKIEPGERSLLLKVRDSGIGITEENRSQVFNGFFHTQETDLYGSRKPYDFNAGGKGLDLLLAKIYGQHFGFDVLLESRRCFYIPTDKDTCPGQISQCPHCRSTLDCLSAGGSTFVVVMPVETTTAGETE